MAAVSSSQNDLESKYAHFLKPIRDLAKNWDIDLASQLQEYLSQIEMTVVSFDGGVTSMDFAEAALLIQGSACIYSRKVEYLYSLVHQVTNFVNSNKKQPSQVEGEENTECEVSNANSEDQFLALDDIQEHRNITLKNEENGAHRVDIVPATPAVLLPIDEFARTSTPLVSRTGEVIGSRNDFRLNTASIHTATGFVLLDAAYKSLIVNCTPIHPVARTALVHGVESLPQESQGAGEVDDNMGIDEGCASDMSFNSNDNADECGDNDVNQVDPQNVPESEDFVGGKKSERLAAAVAKGKTPSAKISNARKDFWCLLDPHKADPPSSLKPFKSGKVVQLPDKLRKTADVEKKRKRKANSVITSAGGLIPLIEFCNKEYFSHMDRIPANPMKTLHFADFEHLYWLQVKKLRNHKRDVHKPQDDDADDKQLSNNGLADEIDQVPADDDSGDECADYDANGGNNNDFIIPDAVFGTTSGALSDGNENDAITALADLDNELSQAEIIGSYEELVRQHVERFLASAQQYAQATDLGKRVAEWQDRIQPRLRQEEERRPFDIHAYGREVLDSLDERNMLNQPVLFKTVAQGKPPFEVCRFFLASLQLANDRNLEIGCHGRLYEAVDTMSLKMLSRRQHFESLTCYQAPSLQHQQEIQRDVQQRTKPQNARAHRKKR